MRDRLFDSLEFQTASLLKAVSFLNSARDLAHLLGGERNTDYDESVQAKIVIRYGVDMSTYVALLRAINVGGNNKIPMAELRGLLENLKFDNVRTLLQSGNVVFDSKKKDVHTIERLLEKETEARFGLAIDYMIRTAEDWQTLQAKNPFRQESERDPSHLVVMFLKAKAKPEDVAMLQSAIKGREKVHAVDEHLFLHYTDGIGDSKLTAAIVERHLKTRGTARNWNTVQKIAEMLIPQESTPAKNGKTTQKVKNCRS